MMTRTIDRKYFEWLISQIDVQGTRTYNDLFHQMYETEFIWMIPRDDDRVHDGYDLRVEFLNNLSDVSRAKHAESFSMKEKGISVLEVLIGLSRRLAFQAGGLQEWWAWQLICNLRLQRMSDPFNSYKSKKVEDALSALVWRTYREDGLGGFFPLDSPIKDQTKLEIWDQMHLYITEIQEP